MLHSWCIADEENTDSSTTISDSPLSTSSSEIVTTSSEDITTSEDVTSESIPQPPATTSLSPALTTEFVSFSVALVVAVIIVLMVCFVIIAIVVVKWNSRSRKSIPIGSVQPTSVAISAEPFSYTAYMSRTETYEHIESTYECIESTYDCIDDKESEVTQETEIDTNVSSNTDVSSNRAYRDELPQETEVNTDDGDVTTFSSNQAYGMSLAVKESTSYENINIEMASTLMFDGTLRPAATDLLNVVADIPHQTNMVPDSPQLQETSVVADSPHQTNMVTHHQTSMATDSSHQTSMVTDHDSPHHTNMVTDSFHQTNMVDGGSVPPDTTESPNVVADSPHHTNMVADSPHHKNIVDADYVAMAADYIEATAINQSQESMEEIMVNIERYSPAKSAAIISQLHQDTCHHLTDSSIACSGVISMACSRHSCHLTTDTSATPTHSDSNALSTAYSLPQLVVEV